jgi:hypothetical protein
MRYAAIIKQIISIFLFLLHMISAPIYLYYRLKMRTRIEWNWEVLDEKTVRAKVIGGWILLHIQQTFATGEVGKKTDVKIVNSESMVFVPDTEHRWNILPRQVETTVHKVKSADFASK